MSLNHNFAPQTEISPTDKDFDDLEAGFEAEDRLTFARDMFRHINDHGHHDFPGLAIKQRDVNPKDRWGAVNYTQFNESTLPVHPGKMAEYILPDIPSPLLADPRSLGELREMPGISREYYGTGERTLVRVAQGLMYRIPLDKNPYAYASITECSVISAHTDTNLIVAHVSYSLKSQTDAVMSHLMELGVDPASVKITASVTEGENMHGTYWGDSSKQLTSTTEYLERYADYGLNPDNITTFKHEYIDQNNLSVRPLAEVIADKKGVLTTVSKYDHGANWRDKFVLDSNLSSVYQPA